MTGNYGGQPTPAQPAGFDGPNAHAGSGLGEYPQGATNHPSGGYGNMVLIVLILS